MKAILGVLSILYNIVRTLSKGDRNAGDCRGTRCTRADTEVGRWPVALRQLSVAAGQLLDVLGRANAGPHVRHHNDQR